jgi:hypothetical protein
MDKHKLKYDLLELLAWIVIVLIWLFTVGLLLGWTAIGGMW